MSHSILFLCTGNACRSQMAEGFARALFPPEVAVSSAGTHPAGLDPRAVTAMAEVGIDISSYQSKRVSEPASLGETEVITLCSDALEGCSFLPPQAASHWPTDDPAKATGSPEEQETHFRAIRDALFSRVWHLAQRFEDSPALGVIGGSGLYDLPSLENQQSITVDTPYGYPSSALKVGNVGKQRVVFLARHGESHTLLPSEINARANIYALKRLGVKRIISVSAVGSLREEIAPGDVAIARQFIDRTIARPLTFFGEGVVAHVSMADPTCAELSQRLALVASEIGTVHDHQTYLAIEGPQFSTRAESSLWRQWGADVIGMTNQPEARLAREAEICYASLNLATDYDCWRTDEDEVRVSDILETLAKNTVKARRILEITLAEAGLNTPCACHKSLDTGVFTPAEAINVGARVRLHAILRRHLATVVRPKEEAGL